MVNKIKASVNFKKLAMVATGATTLLISNVYAEPAPELVLNFDMAKMFTWAQMILDVLMPVLYITMGVALGFLIMRALRSAFN